MNEELQDIGMDQKEAQIYRALLALRKGSVNSLLKKTTIERRTIYDILERLIQKGFASSYTQDGTKIFVPTDPKIILEDLEEKKDAFFKVIPQLTSLSSEENTSVELLQGNKGIKTIFLEIQQTQAMHYAFGNIHQFVEQLDVHTKNFLSRIESKGQKEKIIYPKGEKMLKIKGGEYRVLASKDMPPTPVIIYSDTVCLFVFQNPIQIIKIQNKEIAKSYMNHFKMYWDKAEKA